MTFGEVIRRVILKLQENDPPEYWSLEEIKDAINRGYREFVRLSKLLKVRRPVKLFGSGYFSIPSDAIEILAVYYKGKPLTPISERQLDRTYNARDYVEDSWGGAVSFAGFWADSSGEPEFYTIVDGLIRIVPFPTDVSDSILYSSADGFGVLLSDGFGLVLPASTDEDMRLESEGEFWGGVSFLGSLTESVFVEYVKLPNRLINDEDVPDIPLAYHDALEYYALYELFSREGTTQDIRKASFYLQLFNSLVEQAKKLINPSTPKLNLPFFV